MSDIRSPEAAMQRLHPLTQDQAIAEKLVEEGIHSALQIASLPRKKFIARYAEQVFAGDEKAAERTWQRALSRKSQVIGHYVALKQHNSAHYNAWPFANLTLGGKRHD